MNNPFKDIQEGEKNYPIKKAISDLYDWANTIEVVVEPTVPVIAEVAFTETVEPPKPKLAAYSNHTPAVERKWRWYEDPVGNISDYKLLDRGNFLRFADRLTPEQEAERAIDMVESVHEVRPTTQPGSLEDAR